MITKNYCFTVNSFLQAIYIITICKKKRIIPILFVKYYIINGLGIAWLSEFIDMLKEQFKSKDFKIYVEAKKNYGLFISLVEQKIDYINVKADQQTLKRLREIAKLNKVLINPTFSIVDLSKLKNVKNKIEKKI